MRVFDNFPDFADAVDIVTCPETLRAYGIISYSAMGTFMKVQYEDLVDFCKKHSEFHIVSCTNSALVNYPVETAWSYFLALGDDDPRVYFAMSDSEIRHLP